MDLENYLPTKINSSDDDRGKCYKKLNRSFEKCI